MYNRMLLPKFQMDVRSGNTSTIHCHNAEHRNPNFHQCANLKLQSVHFCTYKLGLSKKDKRLGSDIC